MTKERHAEIVKEEGFPDWFPEWIWKRCGGRILADAACVSDEEQEMAVRNVCKKMKPEFEQNVKQFGIPHDAYVN